ncbi:hypothetical protein Rsub_07990 [Raphidocelis subcapitata]|uniref:C-CAP/cofactor C-like domain-containing protein n=1 Tax=Raphidocelis subcapitata TaxID=307507 RepID=A0A2V0P4M7_9CHLO|nr:hypothetical protein Rsub_07990 [Raphidocelis subcapitata]|eukprot:GBF94818.1 hypothetical protein Rsub_07990 [Raphidocelis subcapitata]
MGSPLDAVVGRLEAVATRLERLELSAASSSGGVPRAPAAAAAAAPAASSATSAAPAAAGGALAAYDALLSGAGAALSQAGSSVGGDVAKATAHVVAAYQKQRGVLAAAALAKQPSGPELQALLQPVAEEIIGAGKLADDRRSTAFQQLKVAAESLNGLSWLAYSGPSCGMPPPPQHIADSWNSAEFYANKLMMAFKGKDEAQMAWVKGVKELTQALQQFVRTHYPQGLKWNPSGCSIAEAQKQAAAGGGAAAPAAPPAGGPKAPPAAPPPPPPGLLLQDRPEPDSGKAAAGGGGSGMQDVFKQLSSAGGVTAGLRKVTDAMKAKNRADRSGVVPAGAAAAPAAAPAAAAAPAGGKQGPAMGKPSIELQRDRKWVVEHHAGNRAIVIERTDPKHVVYIYNCHDSVVQVRGKVNAVSIDNCRKTGVVFEHVIASCELVNCSGMQVQCLGTVPTVSVDKCDGCQIFINSEVAAKDFQLVTAKSSEVNLTVVPADPNSDADAVEHAVPEQFISSFQKGKLVTVAASHGGG